MIGDLHRGSLTRRHVLLGATAIAANVLTTACGSGSSATATLTSGPGTGFKLYSYKDEVTSVAFSPDGQTIAWGSIDDTVQLRRVGDEDFIRELGANAGQLTGVSSVAFSPDGQTLAAGRDSGTGSYGGTVRMWRVRDGARIRDLPVQIVSVLSVAFSPDGQTLASGSDDGTVRLWRL